MPIQDEESAIQQHFLGASIRSFNLNMGWNNQSSTLDVSLVEDDSLYERFDGFIGQLVRFQYSSWIFDGILSNIREVKSSSINRGWDVTISDPRSLLSGVELIINGYTGPTHGVPNLYNIFGYLENFGYGESKINDAGIPWKLIRDSFTRINQQSPIYLAGYPYYVDLSLLPNIPEDFRISGTSVTLLDFIEQICSLANHEFTVVMNGNYIIVLTVNNNIKQLNGSIYRLLRSIDTNYISTEAGFELQYNTTNKFLIGSQVEQIYFQTNQVGESYKDENPISDDTIARYWGLDQNGNVNLATRGKIFGNFPQESNETFYIDGKPISWPGVSWYNYPTDLYELRVVMKSIDTWIAFLDQYKTLKTKDYEKLRDLEENGTDEEIEVEKARLKQITDSIHYGKWNRIINSPDVNVSSVINKTIHNLGIKDLASLERDLTIKSAFKELRKRVYDYLYSYASEYFGLKFMVRIPFVFGKRNEDYSITTSLVPVDNGYIEESLLPQAVNQLLLPNFPYFALDENNKVTCFVRFGPFEITELDLGELSEDSYYIQDRFLFVKATVEKELVFLNKNTAFSPRAVITLPGRVKFANNEKSLGILGEAFKESFPDDLKNKAAEDFQIITRQVGATSYLLDYSEVSLIPNMAAIPLKNNQVTYGPWFTKGMQGKVEFQQDENLNPWTYGGFAQMNAAGTAMVQDVYSTSMIGESGSVEFPGSPMFSIAHQIFVGGPTITQINTSIGENGVTTTYRMEKWSQRFGDQTRHNIEQYKKIHQLNREFSKKNITKPVQPLKNVKFGSVLSLKNVSRKNNPNSPHQMIMASSYGSGMYNIASIPFYEAPRTLDTDNWESIAGCSLDTLFTPYSTDPNSSGMARFTKPSGIFPTVTDLNPFKESKTHSVVVNGSSPSGHTDINLSNIEEPSVYRSMALRAPLVLAGWGISSSGTTVPEDISKTEDWKVGPLDTKWDENRGVWMAGGVSDYIKDLRITQSGEYKLFEYDKYTNGSGQWLTWFTAKGC